MKSKMVLSLLAIPMLLTGCGPSSDLTSDITSIPALNVETFYEAFNQYNWKAVTSSASYTMLGKNIIYVDEFANEGVSGGFVKTEDGIYEYVVMGEMMEVEGMISPNTELETYEFLYSPCDIRYIKSEHWYKKDSGRYALNLAELDQSEKYGVFYGFGFNKFTNSVDNVKEVEIDFTSDQAIFSGQYLDNNGKTKYGTMVTFSEFGTSENAIISSYLKENPRFARFTDWTSVQKDYFKNYGVPVPFFYSGYTEGLYLSFNYITNAGVIIAYDCKSDASHVSLMADELINDGYELTKSGETSSTYEKNVIEDGVNYIVELGFVSNSDLASEEDKICYPNGYLQVVYSYTGSYTHKTLDQLNDIFNEIGVMDLDDPNEIIRDIIVTDGTEAYDQYIREMIQSEDPSFEGTAVYKQLNIKIKFDSFADAHGYVYHVYNDILKANFASLEVAYAEMNGTTYSGQDTEVEFHELTGSYAGRYSVMGYKNYKNIGITYFEIYDYDFESDNNAITILVEIYAKVFFDLLME